MLMITRFPTRSWRLFVCSRLSKPSTAPAYSVTSVSWSWISRWLMTRTKLDSTLVFSDHPSMSGSCSAPLYGESSQIASENVKPVVCVFLHFFFWKKYRPRFACWRMWNVIFLLGVWLCVQLLVCNGHSLSWRSVEWEHWSCKGEMDWRCVFWCAKNEKKSRFWAKSAPNRIRLSCLGSLVSVGELELLWEHFTEECLRVLLSNGQVEKEVSCCFVFHHVFFPPVFKNTIFAQFPYLLPNLVTTFCVLSGLVVAFFFLFDPKSKSAKRPKISEVFTNRIALMTTSA